MNGFVLNGLEDEDLILARMYTNLRSILQDERGGIYEGSAFPEDFDTRIISMFCGSVPFAFRGWLASLSMCRLHVVKGIRSSDGVDFGSHQIGKINIERSWPPKADVEKPGSQVVASKGK